MSCFKTISQDHSLYGSKNRGPDFGNDEFAISFSSTHASLLYKAGNPCFNLPSTFPEEWKMDKMKYKGSEKEYFVTPIDRFVVLGFTSNNIGQIAKFFDADVEKAEEFSGKFKSSVQAYDFLKRFDSSSEAQKFLDFFDGKGSKAAKFISRFPSAAQACDFLYSASNASAANEFLKIAVGGSEFAVENLLAVGFTDEQVKQFSEAFGDEISSLRLLFDSDLSDDSPQACHERIDGTGRTITIVLNDGYIIGGIAYESWHDKKKSIKDPKAKLFYFTESGVNTLPVLNERHALFGDPSSGPNFG